MSKRSMDLRKRALWILCLAVVSMAARAQIQPVWTNRYDNALPGKRHEPLGMAMDRNGNILVAGTSTNGANDADYVLLKYSASGAPVWSFRYSSTNIQDELRGFAIDEQGNGYLTGTSDTVKVDGSTGAFEWSAAYAGRSVAVSSSQNVYVTGFSEIDFATAKLSSAGNHVWTRTHDVANLDGDISQIVAVDGNEGVFVGGLITWARSNGDYRNLRVIKYDSLGSLQWTNEFYERMQGLRTSAIKGMIPDGTGGVIVGGVLDGGPTFLVARVSGDGKTAWAIETGAGSEGVRALAIDGNFVYATGWRRWSIVDSYYETFKFGAAAGDVLWEARYFGVVPSVCRANAIAVDASGHVYVTGVSPDVSTGNDWATIKYDPDGRELWVERFTGSGKGSDEAKGIVLDSAGNVYVTGYATTPQGGSEIVTIKYAPTNQPVYLTRNRSAYVQLPRDPNQTYRLEATTNFSDWLSLGSASSDGAGLFRFLDTNAPSFPRRFYRTVRP